MTRLGGLLILLALVAPCAVSAQDVDILTGKVVGTDGKPVIAARVTAMSIETEITRSAITDRNGRYQIVFPDGGGRYVMRFSFLGMQEALRTVMREAGEELLVLNVTLNPQPIELDAINVIANRPPPSEGRSGDASTDLSLDMLSRLPLPDMDPATLALLAAGVLGTGLDSLSGRMGFSVAGMSDLLNQITLDGMVLGEGGLQAPELGLRMTQVTTSTFDVSRGGFAGGQVSMSSARGNNRSTGRFFYRLEDDALQMSATPTSNPTTNQTIGLGVGGPVIRNRLFYNVSFDLGRNITHRFALSATDPLGAARAGVATDSIARFLDILDGNYGFPTLGQTGAYNQFQDRLSPQLRLDWNIADGHTLSTSFNATWNDQDSTRISNVDLMQHGGEQGSDNWRGLMTLTSRMPGVLTNLTNNFRVSFSENSSEALPYIQMPEGRVSVSSDFEDGTRQRTTLVFGGNRSLPTESYRKDFQINNDVSFMLNMGDQIHRLKAGATMQRNRSISRSTNNLFGTFSFNSLEDFENNLPASFNRSLAERETRSGGNTLGFYLGDTWRPTTPLEITMGVRWDFSRFDQKPKYNPAVEEAFGRRTDFDPKSTQFSPRLGFNLRLNQPGTPTKALTGGVGLTAGQTPGNIFSDAARQTGLPDAEQSLRCIGDVVPIPDWDLFSTGDVSVIPTTCADGGVGSPIFSSRAPNVTLINPDQRMPASLRAEVGYRTQLPLRIQGNFRYTYARGIGLWGYRDINLKDSKTFTLGLENRPFFGDPSAIVERTGSVSSVPSRLHPEFANVYDVTSDLASSTHTFTTQLNA
ncbi:MAG: TonB-dependent receptor domain-containing protein, partial [Longimicrobiales bacterium]